MADDTQWFATPPQGQVPIAFLPVRIETRFGQAADGSAELWVRVFPDDVHVDSFEPPLTTAETAARATFLASATSAAWAALAAQFGARRAAWIVSDAAASAGSKVSDWTTAATTQLLPDRFIVCTFSDTGLVTRQAGADIADGLVLGPSPGGGDPATDPGLAWMRDFNQAVTAGLGIRVPISADAAKNGFARVLVLGVKSKLAPADGAAALGGVLDAHHYSDGLELLPIGTPTNNSDGVRSGYTSSDPGYRTSFAIERGSPMTPSADGQGDGDRVARAFGINSSHFAHVGGADGRQQDAPLAMNTMLWPATFEYYLTNLVNGPVPNAATILPAAREFFVDWVRARGPWPTLRIGRQPYGIAPVVLSSAYVARDGDVISGPLLSLLQTLRPMWRTAAAQVPRVGLGADPDATLAGVLGMSPRSETFVGRTVLGPQYNQYYWRFLAKPIDATWWTRLSQLVSVNLGALATAATTTRLGNSTYLGKHFALSDDLVDTPLTDEPLENNYLTTFAGMTLAQLKAATPSGQPAPLLWLLARHAALRQYASSAYSLLGSAVSTANQIEPELVDIPLIGHTPRVWDHLAMPMPGGSGAVSDYLDQHKADGPSPFVAFWKALGSLAALNTTDLDQVLRETLDLHSHRLDAWYTALASQRLDALRQIQGNDSTLYVGAYGWVDNVRPQPAPISWGYVHAPSPGHAATAAVLRSAYLTHQQSGSNAAAVDLSSTRVRLSQSLLDGVRSGQALGALLGYQLERALHQVTLDAFIAPLRAFAPIEGVTGDRTVDGLKLLDQRSSIPWGTQQLPTLGSTTQQAVDAQISILADSVDAMSDLMLAESVHQLVAGNALRAGATADAIGRGDTPPPVLDITRTPRRGGVITHRLFVMLGGAITPGWTSTPRSQAEPRLAGFAASILGAPERVLASARIMGPDGTEVATVAMTLVDLALGPLDVLLLGSLPSELAARFTRVAWSQRPSTTPAGSTVVLDFARNPAWTADQLSVNELVTVAASASALLAGARAANAMDFTTPDQTVDPSIDTAELQARADAAGVALNAALGHFSDNTAADAALMGAAAFGVANSVPVLDSTAWPVQTAAALAELQSRAAQLAALEAGFDRSSASQIALRDHDVTRLHTVFGAGFQVVPCVTPGFAATFSTVFASSAALLGAHPLEPVTWLARASRVRAGVARLSESLMYAEALSSSEPLTPVVAQLPAVTGDTWAGLPLATGAAPADRLSLVAVGAMNGAVAALLIDEWTETVPNSTETTGLTFNVNDPTARAPQAILIGVQPDTSAAWSIDSVEGTLLEAIELAQLRTVDPDSLGDVGHFLPALLFAINLGGTTADTISTDLTLAAPAKRFIRPPPISPVIPPVSPES